MHAAEYAEVVAVASRDRSKGEAFARENGIPRVHDSYEALLADPGVDAVYNPLPNHDTHTKRPTTPYVFISVVALLL
jgi:predicted dehydrogenase